MNTTTINNLLNAGCQIEGIQADYRQSIDADQIAHDGVCAYEGYELDGAYVSAEEMQAAVDTW